MATNTNDNPNQIDFAKVPIHALRQLARALLSRSLNPCKILPSEDGFPRDWRGIAHLAGLQSLYGPAIHTDADPMKKVLTLWCNEGDTQTATFDNLIKFLGVIDRWDVADDLAELLVQDAEAHRDKNHQNKMVNAQRQGPDDNTPSVEIQAPDFNILTNDDVFRVKQGLPPQIYDAFLLYADEDLEFATEIVNRLEEDHPKFSFKLCLKNRDLLGGTMFEHDAIMRLISERCNRLIVVISKAFLESNANAFFVTFAQALQIEQRRRKIIPCLYENIILPKSLSFYFHLKYSQSGRLYNFWDKLSDSIRSTHTVDNAVCDYPRIQITEIPEPVVRPGAPQIQSSADVTNAVMPVKQPRKKGTKSTSVVPKKVHLMPEPQIRSAFSMIQLNAQSPDGTAPNGVSLQLANCDMTHSETNLSDKRKPKSSRNKSGWLRSLLSPSNGKTKPSPPAMETSTDSCEIKTKTKSKNWLKKKLTGSTA